MKLKQLSSIPVTLEHLDAVEQRLDKKMHQLDVKIDAVEERLNQKMDRVLTTLDKIAGDFQMFTQELTLISGRQSIHTDEIELLTTRVEILENKVFGHAT